MLELRNIIKDYPAGDGEVNALRGIDLTFRESEFVSVLGPSGCGKTTLLNIIGGLDQYTSGDLIINGTSTKDFKDRDWDTYRNHSIGFVFQSYNLIPHQTVLQNVELALTVSGVSKGGRRAMAKTALEQVGLGDQLNKRPNQISGGQMQRVAIARALVNDPDIILADEPTGALDSETSLQVLDILKEISANRLIIMVTHNASLAERYSSRIINMLDGKITDDSAPLSKQELEVLKHKDREAKAAPVKDRKPSMSFGTAFMLSLKNLFTKKGRTTLTAFAGSIGIMGIALILAVSQGMTMYINAVQEDALSSYPLTIEKTVVDMSALMETFMQVHARDISHDKDAVYKKSAIYNMLTAMNNLSSSDNDLAGFKTYLDQGYRKDEVEGSLAQAVTGVKYAYDLNLLVYTKNTDGDIIHSDTRLLLRELLGEYMGTDMSFMTSMAETNPMFASMQSMQSNFSSTGMSMVTLNLWQEILAGKQGEPVNELLKKQYDVIFGAWPQKYDEIVLVLDRNNELDDMSLYALGLESKDRVEAIMQSALTAAPLEKDETSWSYEDIMAREFRVILSADSFIFDEHTGSYTDLRSNEAGLKYLYDNALTLKVTGIIRPNENAQTTMLSGAIGYTELLTRYVMEQGMNSPVIKAQLDSPDTDILTGLPFKTSADSLSDEEKGEELKTYLSGSSTEVRAESYLRLMSMPEKDQLEAMVQGAIQNLTRADIENRMSQVMTQSMGVNEETLKGYIASMSEEELMQLVSASLSEQMKEQYAERARQQLSSMSPEQMSAALDMLLTGMSLVQGAGFYDEIMEFSDSSFEENLNRMGYVDLDFPIAINIYASSFANKEVIEDTITAYNQTVPELSQIKYTDYLGIMMSSITTIINAIAYVLLAFVAISLVVSSIMIGVITLISVQERTKEIGILRAIGASKGDVSSMFTAETVIIGFSSGLLGIGITYLLSIPINLILHHVTGISNLSAYLPPQAAAILVLISIGLSLIAGLIPSRSAAKKDPVVALRTE